MQCIRMSGAGDTWGGAGRSSDGRWQATQRVMPPMHTTAHATVQTVGLRLRGGDPTAGGRDDERASSSARPGSSPGQNRNPPELKPAAGRTRFCFWRPHPARAFGGGACVHEPPGLASCRRRRRRRRCRLPSIHPSIGSTARACIGVSLRPVNTFQRLLNRCMDTCRLSCSFPAPHHTGCHQSEGTKQSAYVLLLVLLKIQDISSMHARIQHRDHTLYNSTLINKCFKNTQTFSCMLQHKPRLKK